MGGGILNNRKNDERGGKKTMSMRRRLRLLDAALVTCWSAAPDRWLQEYYVRGTRAFAAWTCSRSLLLWRFRSFAFLGKPHYFLGKQPSWWCSWGCATSARQPTSFILDASTTSVFFALLPHLRRRILDDSAKRRKRQGRRTRESVT